MKKLLPTLTLLLLSVISFGQDVKVDIYKTADTGSAEWLLLDMDKRPLFTGTDYHRDDTVSLTLEKNRGYYLQVGIKDIFAEDTSLYNIYIDGQQAFGVSTALGYGDHFIPFNTGYPREEEAKIIGGEDVDIADSPWQALFIHYRRIYLLLRRNHHRRQMDIDARTAQPI